MCSKLLHRQPGLGRALACAAALVASSAPWADPLPGAGLDLAFPVMGARKPFSGSTQEAAPEAPGAYRVAPPAAWFHEWPVPAPQCPYPAYQGHAQVARNQEPGFHACRPSPELPGGCGRPHQGVDIYARYGTPIVAPEDGRIVAYRGEDVFTPAGQESKNGGSGRAITLAGASGHSYAFLHTMGLAEAVARRGKVPKAFGETGPRELAIPVRKGEVIAYVGRTGGIVNPHLHLEIRKDGAPVDPSALFPSPPVQLGERAGR